jgi:hypothetical protein
MRIKDNKIEINGALIEIGMNFFDVEKAIKSVITFEGVPDVNDERGCGYIVIENESFYDLYGTVSMTFWKSTLINISIKPDWSKYSDLPDEIDKAVAVVGTRSENGLMKAFGEKIHQLKGTNVYVVPAYSRDGESYAVLIQRV